MKKIPIVFSILLISFCLLSCRKVADYDDGFRDGYDAGYDEACIDFQGDYVRGYDDGYSEGYLEGCNTAKREFAQNVIEEAEYYASGKTGWSVYEAWNSILIYHGGRAPDGFDITTEEEYRQCVDTLVYFCEYIDGLNLCD